MQQSHAVRLVRKMSGEDKERLLRDLETKEATLTLTGKKPLDPQLLHRLKQELLSMKEV